MVDLRRVAKSLLRRSSRHRGRYLLISGFEAYKLGIPRKFIKEPFINSDAGHIDRRRFVREMRKRWGRL